MSQKRNRGVNWDEAEKQLFRTVLKEYSQIIENKNLDSNTNKNKSKAWDEFHKKFNELNRRPRDLSQLKIQWKAMKIHARKVCSTFKKEINKTGRGARPTTPENYLMEIKDLLNPAELLRDHNIYDSDGTMIGDINNVSNQELDNIYIEAIEDVDTQVDFKELSPLVVPKRKIIFNNVVGNSSKLRKISEDEITVVTPKTKSIGMNPLKNVPKRKTILNNVVGNGSKPKKDREEYVSRMLSHSKLLKDEEHMRHMEKAEYFTFIK